MVRARNESIRVRASEPLRRSSSSLDLFFRSSRIRSASSGVVRLMSISRMRSLSSSSAFGTPGTGRAAAARAGGAPLSAGLPPRVSSSCSSDARMSARAGDHRGRQTGQPRDLDAVAAIGSAGENLVQEDDVVFPLARRDVEVDDAAEGVGEVGELVIVRGEERLRPRAGLVAMCSATAHAMLKPSNVAVPRPISSSTTRLFEVAPLRMCAVSCISTMNVDCPRAMLSDAPTRA